MLELGKTKSVFYGTIMIIILLISSWEFGSNGFSFSKNHSLTAPVVNASISGIEKYS